MTISQELSTPDQGRALVEETVRAFGRIDILVANHGVWPAEDAPIAKMSTEQWRQTLAVNLDSVFGLTQAAVTHMQRQPRLSPEAAAGHIVFISSTAGQRGEANHADYAASKGALISLTKSLASELAPQGIYVNCVAPGWVETDMSAPALADTGYQRKNLCHDSAGPRRASNRSGRADPLPLQPLRRLHDRRDRQRQWRRGPRRMKKSLILATLLLCTLPGRAQAAQTPEDAIAHANEQKARALLDAMVQAMGGERWLSLQNSYFEGPGLRVLSGQAHGSHPELLPVAHAHRSGTRRVRQETR